MKISFWHLKFHYTLKRYMSEKRICRFIVCIKVKWATRAKRSTEADQKMHSRVLNWHFQPGILHKGHKVFHDQKKRARESPFKLQHKRHERAKWPIMLTKHNTTKTVPVIYNMVKKISTEFFKAHPPLQKTPRCDGNFRFLFSRIFFNCGGENLLRENTDKISHTLVCT